MQNALTLSIEGMHCGGCVTTALQGVGGVEIGSVEVGSAQMTFDPNQASAKEIAAAINRIGFFARVEESRGDRHV
jgi:copper chaperone